MAHRRPHPKDFAERLERLVALERERDRIIEEMDEILASFDEEKAPTSTIAERLGVSAPAVSSRKTMALKRRRARQQQESPGVARAA